MSKLNIVSALIARAARTMTDFEKALISGATKKLASRSESTMEKEFYDKPANSQVDTLVDMGDLEAVCSKLESNPEYKKEAKTFLAMSPVQQVKYLKSFYVKQG